MISLRNFIKCINHVIIYCFVFSLAFFSNIFILSAEEINWIEIANSSNEIQFIDVNSIKYNNRGLLSVLTKYSEINLDDKKIINTNSYLMAIDCENRLFSKLPIDGEIKQVKNWEIPINNKLIKKTIINSCHL